MSYPSTPRRRRTRFSAFAVGALVVVAFPLVGADPASAATADLVTTDGVGIRVDETAILGPALEELETSLQPFVDQMIYDGAVDSTPVSNPDAIHVSSNLELSFDFLTPGAGHPDGGISVDASIQDIEIQYRKNAWWHSPCGIWVNPDDATINAGADVDRSRLPGTPLTLNPITATWDDDPDVSTSGACWTYLIDDWFNDFFGIGQQGSVADNIEDELNATAQDLIDDLWADHVMPVIDSLDAFGVTFNQIRTDDHGLIVTADVDVTNGVTIPGLGGPYNVSGAQDSGATSNINTLLANRGEVIVSIHPNVVNQFMTALDQYLGSYWGSDYLPANIETTLFGAPNPAYRDDGYYYELTIAGEPTVKPTGTGGAPQLQIPTATLAIGHEDVGPIATFEGPVGAINLKTVVRPETGRFGPDFNASSMTSSMTRTYAVSGVTATPTTILPTVKTAFGKFNADVFETFINLAPISIGGLSVSLCTTCGRYAGDQRYTETFNIG